MTIRPDQLPDPSTCDLIAQDDKGWFDDRPDRILRLRYATDGDPIGPGPEHAVIVFCGVDGIRIRRVYALPRAIIDDLMAIDNDGALAPLIEDYIAKLEDRVADPGAVARGKWLRKVLKAALKRGRRLSRAEFLRLTKEH